MLVVIAATTVKQDLKTTAVLLLLALACRLLVADLKWLNKVEAQDKNEEQNDSGNQN